MVMAHTRVEWKKTLEAARPLVLAQGEVVYAANLVHEEFYRIFSVALSLERPDEFGAEIRFHDHALALWHCSQADSQQRRMAMAAISSVPTKLKLQPIITRIEWAKEQADSVADYRNLLAHNPVMFRGTMVGKTIQMVPTFGGHSMKPIHRQRAAMIKGLSFWHRLRDDLIKLSVYVNTLAHHVLRVSYASKGSVYANVPNTLPGRPRLPSVRHIREIHRILSSASSKTGRRTRKRPSRGSP
jgi:hypothetical protein